MHRIFCANAWKWGVWFRIFGAGLNIQYDSPPRVFFSERYGLRKVWRFGPIKVIRLERSK